MNSKAYDEIWKEKNIQEIFSIPDPNVVGLLEILEREDVKKVLDVGFGLGRHVILFAKNGFETYGIESSVNGYNYCKKWLESEALNADIRIGEMSLFPYEDNFFDFVLAWNVVYHGTLTQIRKAIEEMYRVIRNKGLAYITLTSVNDKHYAQGKEIEPNTFLDPKKIDGDLLHHYSDEKEIKLLFENWNVEEIKEIGYSLAGKVYKDSRRWKILARKRKE